ncbi:MAG: alkaline phosphatase family protein [Solirubrobacteraceae bacterium]
MSAKKLVLAVIDGVHPAMLQRAAATGRTPALARLMADGVYVDDCVAAFPSVTPVCAATIATGAGPDRHLIPAMNWYFREEERYVDYGSSFQSSRAMGITRGLTDLVYNLNRSHLSSDTPTVFELLDDIGVRTAGTTYLIYRGRHRHEVTDETPLVRLVGRTVMRHGVWGPRELFYADLFASRRTGCHSQLGLPGLRDEHSGCVGAYLVEHDLFDFLLLSLPDNDTNSHKRGPDAQVHSLAIADRQLERVMHAAGGPAAFLEDHAVIVIADHAHALVERSVAITEAFDDLGVLRPDAGRRKEGALAVCPSQRSAMVYVLDPERRAELLPRARERAQQLEGVDHLIWREGEEVAVWSPRGELRFAAVGPLVDVAGDSWSVDGAWEALELERRADDGALVSIAYPNALARIWAAVNTATAGDLLLGAVPGFEFVDWGGIHHVGAGAHGSLHRSDSLAPLLWIGTGPESRAARPQWTLRDVVPMVAEHFSAAPTAP